MPGGGAEKEGELPTTSLEFEFHLQFPCGSPSIELSDFRQSQRRGNARECKQPLKKHVASPPISISHRLFRCRYSNSRDVVASSTSIFRPAARAPLRAWWKAIHLLLFPGKLFPLPEKLWLCKSLHSSFAFHIIQRLFPTTEDIKETCRSIL